MYQIISMTGDVLITTEFPTYSKFNFETNSWIPSDENDADCIVVNGERCAIYGKTFPAGSKKVVFVKKIDSADKIQKLSQDFSNDNLDIIEVIVEFDNRLKRIEKLLEATQNG